MDKGTHSSSDVNINYKTGDKFIYIGRVDCKILMYGDILELASYPVARECTFKVERTGEYVSLVMTPGIIAKIEDKPVVTLEDCYSLLKLINNPLYEIWISADRLRLIVRGQTYKCDSLEELHSLLTTIKAYHDAALN